MSLFEDTYQTIARETEGIFRDKGSKFIAYAFPFQAESELKSRIADVKAIHPKARHHCYAYRLTVDPAVFRVNDDGEPSGTAGRPILNALLSAGLTNVIVIVVRYFGGTLLGVPGLINAYKSATVDAISQAEVISKTVDDCYGISFDYLSMNDVMRILKEEQVQVLNQEFDNACYMEIQVRKMEVNTVIGKIEKIKDCKITYLYTR